MSDTFYVTTPIYYANGAPHCGSLYTTIVADTLARFHRQRGDETFFLTGTDEHGINIQRRAADQGLPPKQYVDAVVKEFERVFRDFQLATEHGGYDIFMRTTYEFHSQGVSRLWRTVRDSQTPRGNAPIYKGFYEGWFCAACAAFKTEDEYQKPEAEGAAPRCLIHLTALDRVSEESYFFRLSDYADTLLQLYDQQPSLIQPETRRNEVISFIKQGLQDLSISRAASSISWAIPVPDDPTHTVYVWFDALTNYITAIGYGNAEREQAAGFDKFWRNVVHLVGNDILRFHTVYWHSFLLAANLPLPRTVYAHGMWLDGDGRKWSKTLGNAIYPDDLQRHFTPDMVRYFMLRQMVFGQDGRMSYDQLIERTNGDLASGLGNLTARTVSMINRYFNGQLPADELTETDYLAARRAGIQPDAQEIASTLELARNQFIEHFENYDFSRALEAAWLIIARVDKFLSDAKPWELAKDDAHRPTLAAVLSRAAESLRWLAVLLAPVMPEAMNSLWRQLGLHETTASPLAIDPRHLNWRNHTTSIKLGASEPLFPRLDKQKIMNDIETQRLAAATETATETNASSAAASSIGQATNQTPNTESPAKPNAASTASPQTSTSNAASPEGVASFITIDDFTKIEMRVGQILTAERVPKSDKLLRFTVDIGEANPRQILAGIAEHYEPETLVNRKVAIVSNLAPRKLRGFESQGMVLAASLEGGKPALATFDDDTPNGARLK